MLRSISLSHENLRPRRRSTYSVSTALGNSSGPSRARPSAARCLRAECRMRRRAARAPTTSPPEIPVVRATAPSRDREKLTGSIAAGVALASGWPECWIGVRRDQIADAGGRRVGAAPMDGNEQQYVVLCPVLRFRLVLLFVPIHWSGANASSARIGDLVSPHTDPAFGPARSQGDTGGDRAREFSLSRLGAVAPTTGISGGDVVGARAARRRMRHSARKQRAADGLARTRPRAVPQCRAHRIRRPPARSQIFMGQRY